MDRKLTLLSTFVLFSNIIWFTGCQQHYKSYDLVIKSGRIIDGTGKPWFIADIAISSGRIKKIGAISVDEAEQVIDANGLYVVPGFIDVHTHVDRKIAAHPEVINYLFQGVTTVVGGNCGSSQFPLRDLFDKLEQKGIAINFASLVGHNTIRREVMGKDDRIPTAEEQSRMQELVRQEMVAGAIGFSTGLAYVPGRYSKTEEIIGLVKEIQPFNGLYATHMRNQGVNIKEAIEEAIAIGREAGVPVEISHIKLANDQVWGCYELITEPIETARAGGMQVYMDQYPYTATSSGFTSSFPGWAVSGGQSKYMERIADPDNYKKIREGVIQRRLTSARGINKLKKIFVSRNENHPEYEGKSLAQILNLAGRNQTVENGADLIIDMQKTDKPRGVFFQMAEEDVATLMQKPYNMIASDGKVEIPGVEVPHPRAYGTYPRILAKYVRETGTLSLPDAIRKMSSLPAQAMGFYERGVLKAGMMADIVVFNFDEIKDTATFEDPHRYPKGINWVIVNGRVAAQDGKIITKNSGKILYGKGKSSELEN